MHQVQGSKFESGRGSARNKLVGFTHNYNRVANILESRDSKAKVESRNTDSPVHTTTKSTSFNATAVAKSKGQFKRLSDSEFARKKELGLCFRCDQKFGPNHRCKNRKLNLLIILEAPNTDEDKTEEFFESTGEDVVEGEMKGTMMVLI